MAVTDFRLRVLPSLIPREIELSSNETHIIWRLAGDEWQNLVALSAITGPQGEQGEQGLSGTVLSVVAGAGIDVDAFDPANPIVSLE